MYVKRITGIGAIYVTMDAVDTTDSGDTATWTAVTVTNSWTLVRIPSQTVTNPIFGIKLATNGDEIAVDDVHVTQGLYPTSPIFTTSATVTRPSDPPYVDLTSLLSEFDIDRFSIMVEFNVGQIDSSAAMAEFVNSASPTTQRNTINYATTNTHYGWTVVGDTQGYDPQDANISVGNHKFAGTIDAIAKTIRVALDGGAEQTGTPTSFPTGLDRLNIGHQNDSNQLGSYIRRIKVSTGTGSDGSMTTLSAP